MRIPEVFRIGAVAARGICSRCFMSQIWCHRFSWSVFSGICICNGRHPSATYVGVCFLIWEPSAGEPGRTLTNGIASLFHLETVAFSGLFLRILLICVPDYLIYPTYFLVPSFFLRCQSLLIQRTRQSSVSLRPVGLYQSYAIGQVSSYCNEEEGIYGRSAHSHWELPCG